MRRSTRLFLVLAMVFSMASNAQFSKGNRMVGASVGSIFLNSGNSDHTVTSIGSLSVKTTGYGINFTPSMGWFLSENTIVGVSFLLNPSSDKVSSEENGSTFQKDESRYLNVGLGGFIRNYFLKSGSFLPFGQFGFDAGITSRKTEGFFYGGSGATVYKDTYDGKSSGGFFTNLVMSLGATKMLGKHTGLDIQLGYNFHYTKNTMNITTFHDDGIDGVIDETKPKETITKSTNHRFLISVGFQVFLEKRGKK
ncbi:MAG TPA: hypothetical protein VIZ28_11395 [Chitinophagaceae bacterium]